MANHPSALAKAFAISAVGMLVGFGLCGIGMLGMSGRRSLGVVALYAGAALLIVSSAGMIVTTVLALISLARRSLSK